MPLAHCLTCLPPHSVILRFIKGLIDKSNSYQDELLDLSQIVCNITVLKMWFTFHTMYSLKMDKGIFINFKGLSSCNFQGSDRIEIYTVHLGKLTQII